jgi:hypothetical protein
MPPIKDGRPIKVDPNATTNTGRAAGMVLLDRALSDVSKLTGVGGRVDLLA